MCMSHTLQSLFVRAKLNRHSKLASFLGVTKSDIASIFPALPKLCLNIMGGLFTCTYNTLVRPTKLTDGSEHSGFF